MIIFIDGERKYKFLIGYNVKIGINYWRIDGIEDLRHKEATGSVATVTATTKDWDTYLKPLDGYIYFIEHVGIDGNLGFAFQMPKGIVHGAPRGETEYIYFAEANPLDPMYMPFIITTPNYPVYALYNPTGVTNNSDCYFFGERWKVRKLERPEVPPKDFMELTDYAKGGIGQG